MSEKDSEPPGPRRPLPREPDQGTDPGRTRPFESLYRDPDRPPPESHRTTARHYEPSLSPPEEQPPGDVYHWLYRNDPEPEPIPQPDPDPDPETDGGPESAGPPTERTGVAGVEGTTALRPVDRVSLLDGALPPDGGQPSRDDVAAEPRARRVWPVIVLALVLVAAGVVIALTIGTRDTPRAGVGPVSASPVPASPVPTSPGASQSGTDGTPGSIDSPITPSNTTASTSATPSTQNNTEPYTGGVLPVAAASVTADCQARPSTDGEGQPVRYDARQLTDGDASTAWRCEGDGDGRTLLFSFPAGTRIAELGLINGYTKIDPKTRADRYGEYRRILVVKWTFANGSTFSQGLTDDNRSPQKLRIPVQTAEQVRLTIMMSSKPGGKAKSRDAVLISEATFGAPQI